LASSWSSALSSLSPVASLLTALLSLLVLLYQFGGDTSNSLLDIFTDSLLYDSDLLRVSGISSSLLVDVGEHGQLNLKNLSA